MQTKVQAYVQLADETALKITGNYLDWLSFLTTASRLYKYPYHDQLMIYAQRPDASACAAYELWNGTMHRYIRRGAKGIALLNPTANGMRIRYVFDVSDTGTRADSRNVEDAGRRIFCGCVDAPCRADRPACRASSACLLERTPPRHPRQC